MLVSDYLLPGEDEEEAVGRLNELLGEGDRPFVYAEQEASADVAVQEKPAKRQTARSSAPEGAKALAGSAAISSSEHTAQVPSSNHLSVGLLLGGLVLLVLAIVIGLGKR